MSVTIAPLLSSLRMRDSEILTYQAGIDEVGRGALFGCVVAAAVILSPPEIPRLTAAGVKDSKKLTAKKREELAKLIQERAVSYAIGSSSVDEIDRLNILNASLLAMQRAIAGLDPQPDLCLVDGNRGIPHLTIPQQTIVGGDRLEISIASASILAKVDRDRQMRAQHQIYPLYHLDRNKGYGSPQHLAALQQYGATTEHRRSFAPVGRVIMKDV
jgi:ribonuclease HII